MNLVRSFCLLSYLIGFSAAQDSCAVCGEGKVVGNESAIFEFPGFPSVPCGILQSAGLGGQIPIAQCGFLPPLIGVCECQPVGPDPTAAPVDPTSAPVDPTSAPVDPTSAPVEPSAAPAAPVETMKPATVFETAAPTTSTAPPTAAPGPGNACLDCWQGSSGECKAATGVCYAEQPGLIPQNDDCPAGTTRCYPNASTEAPTAAATLEPCPAVPANGCSVCGDNRCISSPNAEFEYPGYPKVSCSLLQTSGYSGFVPLEECSQLPALIDVCNCRDSVAPTAAPIAPTMAPVTTKETAAPLTMSPVTAAPVTAAPVKETLSPTVATPLLADPTAAPVAPTAAPVTPTLAPAAPTSAPVAPTTAPVVTTEPPTKMDKKDKEDKNTPTQAPVTSAPIVTTEPPTKADKKKDQDNAPTQAPVTPAPVAPTVTTESPTKADKDKKDKPEKKQMMTPINDGVPMNKISNEAEAKKGRRNLYVKSRRGKQNRRFRGQ